nr:PQQ-binding-like beta-propeller repeat protein [uncultured Albidiferax sp.]
MDFDKERQGCWKIVAKGVALASLLYAAVPAHADANDSGWPSAGQNLGNTRYQNQSGGISVQSVGTLAPKWVFTTGGDVSATPAVDAQHVYFPDWAGNLYAVDRYTGKQVWRVQIPSVSGSAMDKARATPVISGNKLIVGTQGGMLAGGGPGGKMLAFNKNTGALLWKTVLDNHYAAIVTQSATVHDGRVHVGVASMEEALAGFYGCCSFRGSQLALDVETGAILWKTYTVPEGYTGGAVWGSSPAIDVKRGQLYTATGNNYSIPDAARNCVIAAGDVTADVKACLAADNYFDAVLALDLKTGAVRWVTKALPADTWIAACIGFGDPAACPSPTGPDYDFGQAPALFTVKSPGDKGGPREFVGAGQKSGKYWVLAPDTGAVQWVTQAGPGGTGGGLQWGSAVDGKRIYTANANSDLVPWPQVGGPTSGMWSGIDAVTGQLLWQTRPSGGGSTSGPVTTTNGVVFGCSLDRANGYMYALDAATGAELWKFASGGSCLSGAAISKGEVYWGSGYSNLGGAFGGPNNKLYAFRLP